MPPPLPAPSQLSGLDVHNVLFAGADAASMGQRQSNSQSQTRSNYPNRQRHQSQPSQTLSQIQVGSIVSRREVFNAMAPVPAPMPHYHPHAVRPIPPSNFVRPSMMQSVPRKHFSSINRAPPAWPVPPPSNAIGSRNMSWQQQGRNYTPRPHPTQPQRSYSSTQTSYDPYTGEPRNPAYSVQRPQPRHSLPQQSYNQRGLREETREGFQFDYID